MVEFDLNTEMMPLGNMSEEQLHEAYLYVLQKISKMIESGGSTTSFIDASNRFYTNTMLGRRRLLTQKSK